MGRTPWITAHRNALVAALMTPLLSPVWAAAPARAHGAPTDPVSRAVACSPEGGARARSAACRAVVTAGGAPLTAWDNVRVANVNGKDRQVIPDGELCSAGLPAYRGLDLPRTDWPATRLSPGARLTLTYASTIPHSGTFRLYLTKPGYDPAKPLTCADLPVRPFATVTDPALTDGAYRITATLPADRTGPQVLFTVWRNSSTPDTYYSCSDVRFPAAEAGAPAPAGADAAVGNGGGSAPPSAAFDSGGKSTDGGGPSAAAGTPAATTAGSRSGGDGRVSLFAGGAAAVLVLTGGAALVLRLRRR
ncbi:hypothetical protein GCM10010129_64510 [Streptomyces fumigatiscleroticus]|nr:hypothetical protein GCM10010129_64510 [Streptomyces fumigatiscleroticus]